MNKVSRHKQAEIDWERNFKDNVATLVNDKHIVFGNPNGSSIYRVNLIISGNRLIVYGDINDAIFAWGEVLTWDFLSGCGFSYMAGKCSCMEHSDRGKIWDTDVAIDGVLDRIGQLIECHFMNWPYEYDSDEEQDFKLDPSKIELEYGEESALDSADSLYNHGPIHFTYEDKQLLCPNGEYLTWEPDSDDYDIGETYDWGMFGAYYALQFSLEQLKMGEYKEV
jgi:hypothetical protein